MYLKNYNLLVNFIWAENPTISWNGFMRIFKKNGCRKSGLLVDPELTDTLFCVSLIFTVDYSTYLIWALVLILIADFSVYPAGLTDFDCGLFRSTNLDTLNLTTDI
jgi:hypothetical protein